MSAGLEPFLWQELEKTALIDQKIEKQKKSGRPLFYNYYGQAGSFGLPSARKAESGAMQIGCAWLSPFRFFSFSFQYFDPLEIALNYVAFSQWSQSRKLCEERIERQLNLKLAVLEENRFQQAPALALGLVGLMGKKKFRSSYLVATKTFYKQNFELSLGLSSGRMKGLFGSFSYLLVQKEQTALNLVLEFDPSHFTLQKELFKQVSGKKGVRGSLELKLFEILRISGSLWDKKWQALAGLTYNLGESKGFLAKTKDPPLYSKRTNLEPIGPNRPLTLFADELDLALKEQGFQLFSLKKYGQKLVLKIANPCYRSEEEVFERLVYLLAANVPASFEKLILKVESEGLLSHEYHLPLESLNRYRSGQSSFYELGLLAAKRDFQKLKNPIEGEEYFQKRKKVWQVSAYPRLNNYFAGSSKKLQTDLGAALLFDGYLFDQLYYETLLSYIFLASSTAMGKSFGSLPRVRSDLPLYFPAGSLHLEEAFLQKNFSFGRGWFARAGGGFFEAAYGGVSGELMFYPVWSSLALGLDGALLWKRKYSGLGFQGVRAFNNQKEPFLGKQVFLSAYYNLKALALDFKLTLGRFLAKDRGFRIEMGRTFASGVTLAFWYTGTACLGKRFSDRGFSLSLPLDLFLAKSSKTRLNYSLASFLKDAGVRSAGGRPLYPILYYERN
ncbi:MAG: YjbH domain-containing protein [Parachlamydiales bacterium]